jgi:hypothetical protein
MDWDDSNQRKQDDREVLTSLKYSLLNFQRQFDEHRTWLRDAWKDHKEALDNHFADDKAVERRVSKLERDRAIILGGILAIEAVLKLGPAIYQAFTKP